MKIAHVVYLYCVRMHGLRLNVRILVGDVIGKRNLPDSDNLQRKLTYSFLKTFGSSHFLFDVYYIHCILCSI